MISVSDTLNALFALVQPPGSEEVGLRDAAGRVLLKPAQAFRDQPPFPASAMDGYAIAAADAAPGDSFEVIGEAAAGHRFDGPVGAGQAVRIFTGAPVPPGGARVIIQEDVTRDGNRITLSDPPGDATHIRPAGTDFTAGFQMDAPRYLHPQDIALLAAMNQPQVTVARRPRVALISTGDELVMPGQTPGPDQIIASNALGLAALCEQEGAEMRMLPIARDDPAVLRTAFDLADGADLIVAIGGASVGDHDLVAGVAAEAGLERAFYKVAMRPGKPLMAGRFGNAMMIGLPGNPVSAMVCGHVFLRPVLRAMQGLPAEPAPRETARLARDLRAGGPREHYMRARVTDGEITVADRQDSALLSVLTSANALLIHPAHAPAGQKGDIVSYLPL